MGGRGASSGKTIRSKLQNTLNKIKANDNTRVKIYNSYDGVMENIKITQINNSKYSNYLNYNGKAKIEYDKKSNEIRIKIKTFQQEEDLPF